MASNLLSFPCKLSPFPIPSKTPFLPCFNPNPNKTSTHLQTKLIFSSISSLKPPSTREEAISQAKLCLSTTLQKPLNNTSPKPKKPRQPRYRLEIPILDESPAALALEIFANLDIKKKGPKPKPTTTLILWPTTTIITKQLKWVHTEGPVQNSVLGSDLSNSLESTDLVVILAPRKTDLTEIKTVTSRVDPKPVVLLNPQWGFEEERELGEWEQRFVSSFEVVYSFMGLEVKGLVRKRRGVVLRCVRDGVMSGEGWVVMMESENGEEMKVVSKFKRRPAMAEVETLLYNVMAADSPVTKSVKFLRDLVANVAGNKGKK